MDQKPAPAQSSAFEQAVALYQQGRFQEALGAARRGLAARQEDGELLNVAGAVAHKLGFPRAAERYFRKAIATWPGLADAHNNLGLLLHECGRLGEAEAAYCRALDLDPRLTDAHNNLGLLLHERGHLEEAEAAFRRALTFKPERADTHNNLGTALHERGHLEEAEAAFRRALAIEPRHADTHYNLGVLLGVREHLGEAEAAYRRALDLNPRYIEAHNNLGVLLGVRGHPEEAEAAYRRVLNLNPRHIEARWNLGMLLLSLGRFGEGWGAFEARWDPAAREPVTRLPTLPFPRWQGEALAGKALLIWPEQGFGDQIQFARYVAELKRRGAARVDLACDANLAGLFATLARVDALVTSSPAGAYDYWTFPMSIPLYCATTVNTIPAELPYLHALPERIERWRERLPPDGLRVGLVWRGSSGHGNDAHRSLDLRTLAPLWSVRGATFVSLQKGAAEDEAAAPPDGQPLIHLGSAIQDFADTAAIVAQLDLVICVDTAVAHLAGALGKPCWVLLPRTGTDWRWMLKRTDSPWYPGVMRLFRQATPGDWAAVVEHLVEQLHDYAMRK